MSKSKLSAINRQLFESSFTCLYSHPWFGKLYKKLPLKEEAIAIAFINNNFKDSPIEIEQKINRLFLDKEKPKNWKIICELLQAALIIYNKKRGDL